MSNRRRHERGEEQEILDSLKVSSYKDAIIDAILNKKKQFKVNVPNYGTGQNQSGSVQNESGSLFSIDPRQNDYLVSVAAQALGIHGVASALGSDTSLAKTAAAQELQQEEAQYQMSAPQPQHAVSGRQWRAIQKYPALIEFLGTDDAEPIVRHIAEKVNELLVVKIGKNSKAINKFAETCVADRHNIKQFFVGPDQKWVCCVIASGPFRGDEAIYFDPASGRYGVARPIDNRYTDVSERFDIVHEFAENKIEGESK